MTLDDAMRKIKALKSMSTSTSPNEAAAALRHMQALMREFGIDQDAPEITSSNSKRAAGSTGAAPWRTMLATVVAGAFQTRVMRLDDPTHHLFCFYGEPGACEVSAYAYGVLLRQLVAARKHHLRRVRLVKNRISRGDAFALGWLDSVQDLLGQPSMGAALARRIELHVDALYPDRLRESPMARGNQLGHLNDRLVGRAAGKSAHFHRGVATEPRQSVQLALALES